MNYKESSYFFLKPCGGQLLSRLAPGMGVTFAVTFMPVQFEDYIHRITFNTERDQYVMLLIGKKFSRAPLIIILDIFKGRLI